MVHSEASGPPSLFGSLFADLDALAEGLGVAAVTLPAIVDDPANLLATWQRWRAGAELLRHAAYDGPGSGPLLLPSGSPLLSLADDVPATAAAAGAELSDRDRQELATLDRMAVMPPLDDAPHGYITPQEQAAQGRWRIVVTLLASTAANEAEALRQSLLQAGELLAVHGAVTAPWGKPPTVRASVVLPTRKARTLRAQVAAPWDKPPAVRVGVTMPWRRLFDLLQHQAVVRAMGEELHGIILEVVRAQAEFTDACNRQRDNPDPEMLAKLQQLVDGETVPAALVKPLDSLQAFIVSTEAKGRASGASKAGKSRKASKAMDEAKVLYLVSLAPGAKAYSSYVEAAAAIAPQVGLKDLHYLAKRISEWADEHAHKVRNRTTKN